MEMANKVVNRLCLLAFTRGRFLTCIDFKELRLSISQCDTTCNN